MFGLMVRSLLKAVKGVWMSDVVLTNILLNFLGDWLEVSDSWSAT